MLEEDGTEVDEEEYFQVSRGTDHSMALHSSLATIFSKQKFKSIKIARRSTYMGFTIESIIKRISLSVINMSRKSYPK